MKPDVPRRLERYQEMRDFDVTAEPSGKARRAKRAKPKTLSFVVQKHAATRLHYDFRLELDGALLSWAVPKGPSLVPGDKRLAVEVEDHPFDYRDFEGTIPKGQYGGGSVIVWDRGTWEPEGEPHEALKKGRLDFSLDGEKLHGRFILVRTRGLSGKKPTWLLMKRSDEHAQKKGTSIVEDEPASVISKRTIEDIENGVTRKREGKEKKLPAFGSIEPELATLVSDVPPEPRLYEIKYDGYRAVAWLDDGEVRIASRRGLDWTAKYGPIAEALAHVRAKNAVFDGEIAYVLEDGRTDFQKLQNTLGSTSAKEYGRLVYFIFDLLFYDGQDLRDEPLSTRKDKLKTILAGEKGPLKMSGDVADGRAFFAAACKLGLEGVIGKRADRPYISGRSTDWVKVKCQKREEAVIVGFTPPHGKRSGIGALLMGTRRNGKSLQYAGKVGTGFSNATLRDLAERLGKLVTTGHPAVVDPPKMKEATWVEPKLVAQVRFSEWTTSGAMRHPTFEGLRDDKPAPEVRQEVEKTASPTIKVTHPERVLDEKSGLTKLDLVRYVETVAERMLPYVAKRPLMLVRSPGGQKTFHQKHAGQGLPKLHTSKIGAEQVIYVEKAAELPLLAQYNAIELHGWGTLLPKWQKPDWIVLDLDPDEALPFSRVVDAALELRAALKTLALESWVKTTGGKGLHVVVPIARRYDWDTVRNASEAIATHFAKAAPDRYVATMAKKARAGKVFIDYFRNGRGATAVLPYSPRARPGMGVALPVAWTELKAIDPSEITIATVPALLARRRSDPWGDLLETKQLLPRALLAALE